MANSNSGSLTGGPLFAVVTCVALGAIGAVIPFLINYARRQDEALDERQRTLETLSQTVASSAEQIGIVAKGLGELTEIVQKNVKHAEQLPHKLQEKIAEFNQQLANAQADDREELERELATLRTAEGDRLEGAADKAQKTAAELAKLDVAIGARLVAAAEALEHLGKAGEALQVALIRKGETFERKTSAAMDLWETRVTQSLADLDLRLDKLARFAAQPPPAAEVPATTTVPAESTPAADTAGEPAVAAAMVPVAATEPVSAEPALPDGAQKEAAQELLPIPPAIVPPPAEEAPAPAKKPRKSRKENLQPVAPDAPAEPAPAAAADPVIAVAVAVEAQPSPLPVVPEPAKAGHAAAVSPGTAIPESGSEPSVQAVNPPAEEPAKGEFSQVSPEEGGVNTSVSADGATRILVTSYIGIGNRLYIRGDGPGLSLEKGIPLQFVSIGKWRWETAEATERVRIRLLKNDHQESAALGEILLEPGHQAEVTATF